MLQLNYTILECSPSSFLFVDETEYRTTPSNPVLTVKFPSLSKEYSCLIRPCEVNIINTKLLCYSTSCIDFPDGLYEITYSIEPNEYVQKTIKYLKTAQAKDKIKELLTEKDIDKDLINQLYKLDVYLQAGEALADVDSDKALDYFNIVNKSLDKLNCQ